MNIVIDTNLWISFLIGKKLSVLKTLLLSRKLAIFVCDDLIDEIKKVTSKTKILKYISEEDVIATLELIDTYCIHVVITKQAVYPVRDAKDVYLLSLAETVCADFILTGDKDLLTLSSHHQTKIVTHSTFISEMLI